MDRDAVGLEAVAAKAQGGAALRSRPKSWIFADAEAIRALPAWAADRFGHLDLLINNAGVAFGGRFDETDLEDFEWVMDINLRAVVRMSHAFLPMLRAGPKAQIVNISSLLEWSPPPDRGLLREQVRGAGF